MPGNEYERASQLILEESDLDFLNAIREQRPDAGSNLAV